MRSRRREWIMMFEMLSNPCCWYNLEALFVTNMIEQDGSTVDNMKYCTFVVVNIFDFSTEASEEKINA